MTKLHESPSPSTLPAHGRIFHYHLKKCGGTTMNAWLDGLSSAARSYDPHWNPGGAAARYFPIHVPQRIPYIGRAVFHWADVVHTHAPIWRHAPPGTFRLTMLRDPVQRLISQFKDWRGLTDADLEKYDDDVRACIVSTRTLTLTEFLAAHGRGLARFLVDNYMTRALAASRSGRHVFDVEDMDELLGEALRVLAHDYEFVGIVEAYDLSMNALCGHLGLPPASPANRFNAGRVPADDPALALSPEDIQSFTGHDRILYNFAIGLFAARHRPLGQSYGLAAFEAEHAEALLSRLRAFPCDGAARYGVQEPCYGTGLHLRDGGTSGNNAVWTRPGLRATLFIPVPAGMRLQLLLWVRGYAEPRQREALRLWVDGVEAPWSSEAEPGYAELLVTSALPLRNFVRLELEVPHMTALAPEDERPRGICFDAYGWRPHL